MERTIEEAAEAIGAMQNDDTVRQRYRAKDTRRSDTAGYEGYRWESQHSSPRLVMMGQTPVVFRVEGI